MKRIPGALGCFLAAIYLSLLPATPDAAAREHPTAQPGRYIVVYRDSGGARSSRRVNVAAQTARLERTYGFKSRFRYLHALKGFAGALTREQVAELRRDSRIALVTPDRVLHARGRVPLAPGESVPTGIGRIEAATAGGVHQASTAAVAVLDTGVQLGNPELSVSPGPNCVGGGSSTDDNGHGTMVAGVIGARNTGSGLVGVAPGTQIYAVKVLDSNGAGSDAEVLCGIDWVTANASALNIRVANMSLGGPDNPSDCTTNALHLAICDSSAAGVTYTVAAPNSPDDFASFPPDAPGAFPEVLTVTAAADTDGRPGGLGPSYHCPPLTVNEVDDSAASFSAFAVRQEDTQHVVAAPGVAITSTAPGGQQTECGTSFAAPHVAGVVALCTGEGGVAGPCAAMSSAEVIQQIRADAAANATPANGFAGDPNHSFGRYYGYLVSALDPSIRRIPLPPPPAPPPPAAPADTHVDLLALRVRRVQDVDKLRILVRLGEAGKVTVRATVRVPSAHASRRVSFRPLTRNAVARRSVILRPRLSRRSLRLVKRALRRGRRLEANLVIVARDRPGNSLTKHRGVRLRP